MFRKETGLNALELLNSKIVHSLHLFKEKNKQETLWIWQQVCMFLGSSSPACLNIQSFWGGGVQVQGRATSSLLTKQSGTRLGLGRARWVSDKLCRVTWSAALQRSLPVKYSWLLFPHCPLLPLKMDLEPFSLVFRSTVWFSTGELQAGSSHFSISRLSCWERCCLVSEINHLILWLD